MFVYLVPVLLLCGAMLVHEGAHAGVAWLLGIPIRQFSIGLPWPSWLTLRRGKLTLSPLLFMAFVAIDDEVFFRQRFWKKAYVALAGPLANLVVGIVSAFLFLGAETGGEISRAFAGANLESVAMLVKGDVPFSALVSPVGLVKISADILSADIWQGALFVWLILSFGIPFVNLLPIPALDGGQILMGAIVSLKGNTPKAVKGARLVNGWYFGVILTGMLFLVVRDILDLW